jgi:uncharacterized protein (DUF2267 family)
MQETQLLSAVRDTAQLPDQEQARDAVRATLTVLGQRLAGGEPHDLASQLPKGIADALPERGAGERFGVDDFYQRVADNEAGERTPEEGRRHARAVMAALKAGLAGREFDHVVEQLSPDYADLVGTGPVQH